MQYHDKHRRRFIAGVVAGGVVLPSARALLGAKAFAEDEALSKLELDDPQASALAYTHDAGTAEGHPAYAEGELCSNCMHIQGNEGDAWRPCAIFPAKLVNAGGWCSAWVAKA
ncbi:high-potential iron-sulfur protein [soil metagenome]